MASCSEVPKEAYRFKSSVNDAFLPLDSLLQDYSEKELISGGVGLVYNKGDILYHNAFGYRDIEKNTPYSTEDIFRIASMTKPITSVAAMILFDEGKFKLDDPVSKYIPEYANLQILDRIDRADSSFVSHPFLQVNRSMYLPYPGG